MAYDSELEARDALQKRINYYVNCENIDWWSPLNRSEKPDQYSCSTFDYVSDDLLDYASFLLFAGYQKESFTEEWEKYRTKKVCVGYSHELRGFSGQVDERGNVEVTPDYDSTPEYEEQKILKAKGEVSDTVYYLLTPSYVKCRELRKEFQDKWLDFYSKNKMRTFQDGFYLNVKTNVLDRTKFKFRKAEETERQIKRLKRVNLPFLLLSIIRIFLTSLSFLYSLKGFQLNDLSILTKLLVTNDSFFHLQPDFNYVLFYSLWAVSFAVCVANCIYFGEYSSWILLVLYLILSVVLPLGSTGVLFIVSAGKTTAFDFFAFLLTCTQLILEIPIFICLLSYRFLIKKRISTCDDNNNKNMNELLKFFTEFQSKGMIYSFSEYRKKWTAITGKEYSIGK